MVKLLILVCDFVGAAALVWVLNSAGLIPFRRAKDAHWTERARLLYPVRIGAATCIWVLPLIFALGQYLVLPELTPHWALVVLAGWLGAIAGTYPFDRETLPWLRPRAWLHHVVASWVMRFGVWFVFLGTIALMPEKIDWRGWLLAVLFIAMFLGWCWGGLLWVWRKLGVLAPAAERLRRIVAETSGRIGVPVHGLWLLRSAGSLAYALPYTGELLFTERLLERHPDDEIAAICAHELGHLAESKATVATRVLANLGWLVPWIFLKPLVQAFGLTAFVVLGLGTFVIIVGARRLSQHLERRADHVAHTHERETGTYARALARLYEDNLVPAVLPARRRSHPDLYERLLAVGVQPDFDRPKPPRANAAHAIFLTIVLGLLVGVKLIRLFP